MGEAVEDEEIKLGFLMEAAQTHQQLAERVLEKLERHTRGLDDIVRQEIRRTLIEELRAVHEENSSNQISFQVQDHLAAPLPY